MESAQDLSVLIVGWPWYGVGVPNVIGQIPAEERSNASTEAQGVTAAEAQTGEWRQPA